ncbi:MAG: hypothetical protein WCF23_07475, partial [Candidatus Nitrosopolaris sp.]
LLSYAPSAITIFKVLFSKALSTKFLSLLPSCISSLVTSSDTIFLSGALLFYLIPMIVQTDYSE